MPAFFPASLLQMLSQVSFLVRAHLLLLLAALALISTIDDADAQVAMTWGCPGQRIEVRTSSFVQATDICKAARAAAGVLGACGLPLTAAVTVDVSDDVYKLSPVRKAGDFLPGGGAAGKVRVMSRAGFGSLTTPQLGASPVPVLDLYRSVVAHEIAHAIFHEHTAHLDLPVTAHEYVAYAVQVGSLPAVVRAGIVLPDSRAPESNLLVFSHFLLMADPDRFGLVAWEHFARPGNGCAFLRKVIAGDVHFPPPSD